GRRGGGALAGVAGGAGGLDVRGCEPRPAAAGGAGAVAVGAAGGGAGGEEGGGVAGPPGELDAGGVQRAGDATEAEDDAARGAADPAAAVLGPGLDAARDGRVDTARGADVRGVAGALCAGDDPEA